MVEVLVQNDDIESAIRYFKKRIEKDGIMQKLKEREKSWKPSVRRKVKARRAEIRRKRRLSRARKLGNV